MNPFASLPGTPHVAAAAKAPRFDMYVFIHKALRQYMSQTLSDLGRVDVTDADERRAALDAVDALLQFMRSHVQHENDFVHTAIEARRPGGARHTADDHLVHVEAISNLEDEARALRDAREEQRPLLALRLYRHLADFIGENLQHMQIEETQNNAALWALYSDDELRTIHDRLLAAVPPAEHLVVARWMAAAMNIHELCGLCAELRQKLPPPAFDAALGVMRPQLSDKRWGQLARSLGLAPASGAITA